MGLSRTAKILLAALLVAAAGFAWINFFNQDQFADTPQPPPVTTPSVAAPSVPAALLGQGSESPAATGSDSAGVTGSADAAPDAVLVGEEADADGAVTVTADDASPVAEDTAVVTPEPAVDVSAPPVVVTQAPTVVTRDLVVGDLPFLVTSPPVAEAVTAEDSAAGANRPATTQRTSVNPFSPIIVQSPAPTPVVAQQPEDVIEIVTDAGQPAPAAVITDVPVTSASGSTTSSTATAVAPPPAAPAPRTVAPATSTAAALPRPLPSGTLPVTPEILREARAPQQVAETPVPVDLGTLAAIRVPDEPEPQEPLPTTDSEPDDTQVAVTTPDVLGTDRPNEPAAVAPEPTTTVSPAPTLPLAVGGDPLSRYLRDNNVRFTGSVLGPLSVGVFRSARFTEPVVLTLGQALPDTDIILSDLRGYEARFSLGDTTQTLSLDLRR